jgi:hypothetical protein
MAVFGQTATTAQSRLSLRYLRLESDSRQDSPGAAEGVSSPEEAGDKTRAVAAPEALRAAASGTISATVKGSHSGPLMTLGNAVSV